jgi:hypothetical protein
MLPRPLAVFWGMFLFSRSILLMYYKRCCYVLFGGLTVSSWRIKSAAIFGSLHSTPCISAPGLSGQFVQQRLGLLKVGSIEVLR